MNKVFLFPLKNSVLLKKVTLPYHVFEPRFRQMVKDAIKTMTPIAIVEYREDGNYEDAVTVFGDPKILSEYPDGRMDIYITGQSKCRLRCVARDMYGRESNTPYQVYFWEGLAEDMTVRDHFATELVTLKNLLEKWAFGYLPDDEQKNNFRSQLQDPELMVNYCVTFLIDDLIIKRKVVESFSLERKVDILIDALAPKEIQISQFLPPLRFN